MQSFRIVCVWVCSNIWKQKKKIEHQKKYKQEAVHKKKGTFKGSRSEVEMCFAFVTEISCNKLQPSDRSAAAEPAKAP